MLIEQTEKIAYLTEHLHFLQRNKHVIDLQIATNNKAATERGSLVVADAKILLDGKIVPIHIGLDGNFPQSLPIILLQSDFLPKRVPHIESDGFVCYSDQENLVIDSSVPDRILVAYTMITSLVEYCIVHAVISGVQELRRPEKIERVRWLNVKR